MILKKVFNPVAVIRYMKIELLLSIGLASAVWVVHQKGWLKGVSLPFSVAGILGSALAIFLAFRNNNSYARWWEARTLWGGILNNSRILLRQLIANADNSVAANQASEASASAFKVEMGYRQIAFIHALRMQLRGISQVESLEKWLSKEEYQIVISKENKANFLLHLQGLAVKKAIRDGLLGGFDNISIEPTIAGLNNFQGSCERIKSTPLLRQYHFFTKLFLWTFMVVLPLSLVGDFSKMGYDWMMIPVSCLISFVFGVMGKVGEVNEDPFENTITDIPIDAICRTIERDIFELLGETTLPDPILVENGFLN